LNFENKFVQQRIEKAELLKKEGYNPYANDSKRNTTIKKYLNVNSDIYQKENKRDEKRHYTVAGRIKLLRIMGKASFVNIEDESGSLQVYVARDNLPEGFYNNIFKKNIEVGDIIEVNGYPFVTGKGEL
jgi:lysyl-tRNA synthetase class 2